MEISHRITYCLSLRGCLVTLIYFDHLLSCGEEIKRSFTYLRGPKVLVRCAGRSPPPSFKTVTVTPEVRASLQYLSSQEMFLQMQPLGRRCIEYWMVSVTPVCHIRGQNPSTSRSQAIKQRLILSSLILYLL